MMEPYSLGVLLCVSFFAQGGNALGGIPLPCTRLQEKLHLKGTKALPTLIFEKHRKEFMERFPRLRIIQRRGGQLRVPPQRWLFISGVCA